MMKNLTTTMMALCAVTGAAQAALLINGDFTAGTDGTLTGATGGGNSVPTGWSGNAVANQSLVTNAAAGTVSYNAGDTATGSFIEQSVTTSQTGRFYALDWTQTNAGNASAAINSTLISGANTISVGGRTGSNSALINAASSTTTVRFTDRGPTVSTDPILNSAVFDLANGSYNVAYFADISVSGQLSLTEWLPEYAVDGLTSGRSDETYHSAGFSAFYDLNFQNSILGVNITSIEIDARSGFNTRKGDSVSIFDTSGSLIETIDISGNATDPTVTLSGGWSNVGNIRVTGSDSETLNIGEIRTFATFNDGIVDVVPEPSSAALLGLAGMTMLLRRRK